MGGGGAHLSLSLFSLSLHLLLPVLEASLIAPLPPSSCRNFRLQTNIPAQGRLLLPPAPCQGLPDLPRTFSITTLLDFPTSHLCGLGLGSGLFNTTHEHKQRVKT